MSINPSGQRASILAADLAAKEWRHSPYAAHAEHIYDGGCAICRGDTDAIAATVVDLGWRPPPRVIETPEAIAQERTGTVIRSRHGDVGSVDHGARGEWTGDSTVIHMLDFATAGRLYVGELHSDLASTFPWTVLHEPEEAR